MATQTSTAIETTHQIMAAVLEMKDARFVDGTKVMSVLKRCNVRGAEATIYFLRELHQIVRKLPLKIFNDEQDRLRLMDAVQDALDRAIDEEDA